MPWCVWSSLRPGVHPLSFQPGDLWLRETSQPACRGGQAWEDAAAPMGAVRHPGWGGQRLVNPAVGPPWRQCCHGCGSGMPTSWLGCGGTPCCPTRRGPALLLGSDAHFCPYPPSFPIPPFLLLNMHFRVGEGHAIPGAVPSIFYTSSQEATGQVPFCPPQR